MSCSRRGNCQEGLVSSRVDGPVRLHARRQEQGRAGRASAGKQRTVLASEGSRGAAARAAPALPETQVCLGGRVQLGGRGAEVAVPQVEARKALHPGAVRQLHTKLQNESVRAARRPVSINLAGSVRCAAGARHCTEPRKLQSNPAHANLAKRSISFLSSLPWCTHDVLPSSPRSAAAR